MTEDVLTSTSNPTFYPNCRRGAPEMLQRGRGSGPRRSGSKGLCCRPLLKATVKDIIHGLPGKRLHKYRMDRPAGDASSRSREAADAIAPTPSRDTYGTLNGTQYPHSVYVKILRQPRTSPKASAATSCTGPMYISPPCRVAVANPPHTEAP